MLCAARVSGTVRNARRVGMNLRLSDMIAPGGETTMGMPPNMPPQQPPQANKTSPLVWILGGIAVLFFGGMITCGVVGFMATRVLKNAGFDSDEMKRNPGIAMAKMVAALNKDLEIVSSNDR